MVGFTVRNGWWNNMDEDWIFKHKIMICDDCEYRGENTIEAYKHLKETGHKGFHSVNPFNLTYKP